MDSSTIAIAVTAVVLAAVGWKLLRGGLGDATFVITVGGEGREGVQVRGTVAGKDDEDVRDFVARMELETGAKIWGVPDGKRMMLRFNTKVPENLQQRCRNYFYN